MKYFITSMKMYFFFRSILIYCISIHLIFGNIVAMNQVLESNMSINSAASDDYDQLQEKYHKLKEDSDEMVKYLDVAHNAMEQNQELLSENQKYKDVLANLDVIQEEVFQKKLQEELSGKTREISNAILEKDIELQEMRDILSNAKELFRQDNKVLEGQIISYKKQLQDSQRLSQNIQKLTGDNKQLNFRIQEFEKQIGIQKQANTSLMKQIDIFKYQLIQKEITINDSALELGEVENKYQQKEIELQKKNEEFDAMVARYDNNIRELIQTIVELEQENNRSNDKNTSQEKRRSPVRRNVSNFKTDDSEIHSQYNDEEEDRIPEFDLFGSIQNQNAHRDEEDNRLIEENNSLKEEIEKLKEIQQQKDEVYSHNNAELVNKITALERENKDIKDQSNIKDRSIADLQNQLVIVNDALSNQKIQHDQQTQISQNNHVTHVNINTSQADRITQLENQVKILTQENINEKNAKDQLRQNLDQVNQKNILLNDQNILTAKEKNQTIADKDNELQNSKKAAIAQQQRIDDLGLQIQKFQSDIVNLQRENQLQKDLIVQKSDDIAVKEVQINKLGDDLKKSQDLLINERRLMNAQNQLLIDENTRVKADNARINTENKRISDDNLAKIQEINDKTREITVLKKQLSDEKIITNNLGIEKKNLENHLQQEKDQRSDEKTLLDAQIKLSGNKNAQLQQDFDNEKKQNVLLNTQNTVIAQERDRVDLLNQALNQQIIDLEKDNRNLTQELQQEKDNVVVLRKSLSGENLTLHNQNVALAQKNSDLYRQVTQKDQDITDAVKDKQDAERKLIEEQGKLKIQADSALLKDQHIVNLKADIKKLNQDLLDVQNQKNSMDLVNKTQFQKIQDLEKQLNGLTDEKILLQKNLDTQIILINDQKKKIVDLEAGNVLLNDQLRLTKDQQQKEKIHYDGEILKNFNDIQDLNKRIKILEDQIAAASKSDKTLKNDIKNLQDQIINEKDLHDKQDKQKNLLTDKLKQDIEALNKNVIGSGSVIKSQQVQKIKDLDVQIKNLNDKIIQDQEIIDDLNRNVKKLEDERVDEKITKLAAEKLQNAKDDSMNKEISMQKGKIIDLEKKLKQLEQEKIDLNTKKGQLEKDFADSESNSLKERASSMKDKSDIASINSINLQQKAKIFELEKSIDILEDMLDKKDLELKLQEEKINRLMQNYASMKKRFKELLDEYNKKPSIEPSSNAASIDEFERIKSDLKKAKQIISDMEDSLFYERSENQRLRELIDHLRGELGKINQMSHKYIDTPFEVATFQKNDEKPLHVGNVNNNSVNSHDAEKTSRSINQITSNASNISNFHQNLDEKKSVTKRNKAILIEKFFQLSDPADLVDFDEFFYNEELLRNAFIEADNVYCSVNYQSKDDFQKKEIANYFIDYSSNLRKVFLYRFLVDESIMCNSSQAAERVKRVFDYLENQKIKEKNDDSRKKENPKKGGVKNSSILPPFNRGNMPIDFSIADSLKNTIFPRGSNRKSDDAPSSIFTSGG